MSGQVSMRPFHLLTTTTIIAHWQGKIQRDSSEHGPADRQVDDAHLRVRGCIMGYAFLLLPLASILSCPLINSYFRFLSDDVRNDLVFVMSWADVA
jgi:hypothetical protein